LKARKRRIVHFNALVCVLHIVIVIKVELPPATRWYDLEGVAIDGGKLTKIIGGHPAVAIPIFGVEPETQGSGLVSSRSFA